MSMAIAKFMDRYGMGKAWQTATREEAPELFPPEITRLATAFRPHTRTGWYVMRYRNGQFEVYWTRKRNKDCFPPMRRRRIQKVLSWASQQDKDGHHYFAAYSLIDGCYEQVIKDIERNRLDEEQVYQILRKLVDLQITQLSVAQIWAERLGIKWPTTSTA